eukprot:g1242.t1
MFDGPQGLELQNELKEFLQRPEHQDALAQHQKEEFLELQDLKERELESTFASKLVRLDPYLQKRLRPMLRHSVLRRLLMSVSNSSEEEFANWLRNPRVMKMFTQAERLLRKGQIKERDLERALIGYLSESSATGATNASTGFHQMHSVVLTTSALLQPMNEHVQERKKGNEAYNRGDLITARSHYDKALAVLDIIRGSHSEDQNEIDKCRREVQLNIAAVLFSNEEYGACIDICTRVLDGDPQNTKALLRRGKAYKRRHEYTLAKRDLEQDPSVTVHTESADVSAHSVSFDLNTLLQNDDGNYGVAPAGTGAWGPSQGAWGPAVIDFSNDEKRDPTKTTTTERALSEREAEIREREKLLEQRQNEIANLQRLASTAADQQMKNWPPCSPMVYHDIDAEIPTALQWTVRNAYRTYLLFCFTLLYNFLCLTLAFAKNVNILAWMFAGIYVVLGIPGAFILWYKRLYNAAARDRAITFLCFFIGNAIHIGFCIWASIAIPLSTGNVDSSFTGFIEMIEKFDKAKWLGGMYLAGFILWVLNVLASSYVWQSAMRDFRGRGGPEQLENEAQYQYQVLQTSHHAKIKMTFQNYVAFKIQFPNSTPMSDNALCSDIKLFSSRKRRQKTELPVPKRQKDSEPVIEQPIVLSDGVFPEEEVSFEALGLSEWISSTCRVFGMLRPTSVQAACIPPILQGRPVIGIAQTGSGKTAAFALPILQKLVKDPYGVFALVLTPTRELAFQINDIFCALAAGMTLRTAVIVGGLKIRAQVLKLAKRPHVVISTPGRLSAIIDNDGQLSSYFRRLAFLIVDEADQILESSFETDLKTIISILPKRRQTLLLSATMTNNLLRLQKLAMPNAFVYQVYEEMKTVSTLSQYYLFIPQNVKDVYLHYLLQKLDDLEIQSCIIFCSSCIVCRQAGYTLQSLDYDILLLHSEMNQQQRLMNLDQFKTGLVKIMVATDLASRGLDIPSVDLVLNFDLPQFPRDYVHRVGRTARAGRTGKAISFVSQYDIALVHAIEDMIGRQLEEFEAPEETVLKGMRRVYIAKKAALLQIKKENRDREIKEKLIGT